MATSYNDGDANDYCSERQVVFPNLLTDEQCDRAIEMFTHYDREIGLVGYDYGANPTVDHTLRKCEVTYVPNDERTKWVHDICENALLQANNVWRFNISDFSQPMRQMKYEATDHFQSWHQDHGPGKTSFRKLSIVVQLDRPGVDFEGGEFTIAGGETPVEYYQRGAAIVFPTYYYHRVAPITSGLRRTIVHRAIGPRFQ